MAIFSQKKIWHLAVSGIIAEVPNSLSLPNCLYIIFPLQPHIPNPAASLLTSTPKPRPATPPRQVQPTTAHVIPTHRLLAPEGPPVSMAATLNDALCQNVQLQCVYFEEWKNRLAVLEERFLQPRKEAPLMNETVIVNTLGKSLVTILLVELHFKIYV